MFEFRVGHTTEEIDSMFVGKGAGEGPRKVLLRVFCHAYGNKVVAAWAGQALTSLATGRLKFQ